MKATLTVSFCWSSRSELIFDYSAPTVDTPSSSLTQIPTHFRERLILSWGANSSGLRVFLDFRG